MSSQQELIEAINTISEDKNKAFDTPATVLRVEGDTVWVHIDGGIDETPVQRTIDCDEGETVQVRISNGSAFLVGNASAPPTDDTTANEAHFVAEQADEKATEAVESVNAISQTVRGKVSSGDSNIAVLSSTMYQNENGVNIFNDTLAAGDSYAHIDGDEFCIREVTSAGIIDDTNDDVLASFGSTTKIGKESGCNIEISDQQIEILDDDLNVARFNSLGLQVGMASTTWSHVGENGLSATKKSSMTTGSTAYVDNDKIGVHKYEGGADDGWVELKANGLFDYLGNRIYVPEPSSEGTSGQVLTTDGNGGRSWTTVGGDEWTNTATVGLVNNTDYQVDFNGLNDDYGYELFCQDKLIGISSVTKIGSGSNIRLIFKVTGAAIGDVCKLRIIK